MPLRLTQARRPGMIDPSWSTYLEGNIKRQTVSDETLARALETFARMVHKVLADPGRWLAIDDEPTVSAPGRFQGTIAAVKGKALGQVSPGSSTWAEQPRDARVAWWVNRISATAGTAAAAPRIAGALAGKLPLQGALSASATGLTVCAVAREHGVTEPQEWVPLLGKVIFKRDNIQSRTDVFSDPEPSELSLDEGDGANQPADQSGASRTKRSAQTLWRLAGAFRGLQDLFEDRPRGGFLARKGSGIPGLGAVAGWVDERGGIREAAAQTTRLLS